MIFFSYERIIFKNFGNENENREIVKYRKIQMLRKR